MKRTAFLSILFFFSLVLCYGAGKQPRIEKQPSWVQPLAVNYTDRSMDDEAEDGYIDLLLEKQISLAQQSVFVKKAMRVLSETGAQNLSEVRVVFQPSYQEVLFHSIQVLRDGKIISQLDHSRIKTIQQEDELDRSIYNGSLTALLILEDLRKDDVVEYSYTLKGFNPVFQNKYTGSFYTQFGVPIYQIYYRLVVPSGRQLTIQNSLANLVPKRQTSSEGSVYEWTGQRVKPLLLESNLPSWLDVYPAVMVGEFPNWKTVNDWAVNIFPMNVPLSAGLKQKVEEIASQFAGAEERTLAALRFVQDDIRYMGIEMGENSHRPHAPSQVFQQRFGDCKDKAYLLCTLLRVLGIEAYPVLINTDYKKTISTWPPSPTSFNHTTVTAIVNGKQYWFDATIAYQRGRLQDVSFPDYQVGLVVKPGNSGLTNIPLQNNGKVHTKETFYVEDFETAARLVVATSFTGSFADNVRYDFKSNSRKEMLFTYQEMYKPYFKKIAADSISFTDNELTGEFITREYYTVPNFWTLEKGQRKVLIEPYLVNTLLRRPEESGRQMPFAVQYPARYTEEIELHLPEEWLVDESMYTYDLPGGKLSYNYSQVQPRTVLLHYKFETKTDHIQAGQVSDYAEQLEEASKNLAFELTHDKTAFGSSTKFRSGSDQLFTGLYLLLGLCAFGTFVYRRNQRRNNPWR
jgi:transglutaminase-like putative cysteine protease